MQKFKCGYCGFEKNILEATRYSSQPCNSSLLYCYKCARKIEHELAVENGVKISRQLLEGKIKCE